MGRNLLTTRTGDRNDSHNTVYGDLRRNHSEENYSGNVRGNISHDIYEGHVERNISRDSISGSTIYNYYGKWNTQSARSLQQL